MAPDRSRSAARPLRTLALAAMLGAAPAAPALGQAATPALPPASAETAFERAHLLYQEGLFAPAARAFADLAAAHPRDPRAPEALFFAAEAALAAGDDLDAAARFERFEADHGAHPLAARARFALGRFYYAQGRYDDAEAALLAARERPLSLAERAEAAYLLGQTARRQSRPDAAAAYFAETAAYETALAPEALYALASVRAGIGDAAGTVQAYEQLAAQYPASAANAAVGLGLAEAYVRERRFQDAADEIARRRPALAGSDAARADLLAGEAALRLGRAAEAERSFAAVPPGSPYLRRATFGRARLAFDARRYDEAARGFALVRAAAEDALGHEATYYEGLALKQALQLGEAETRFAAAAEQGGAFADAAWLELGFLRYERRRYQEAAAAFSRVLLDFPQSAYAGEAARMIGESYAALGDNARARDAFREAERLGTATADTRAEVAFQDAFALFRAGNYDAAQEALVRVFRADPTGPRAGEALFWAGEAAFQAERYARAEELLSDFLRRFPEHRQADAARYVLAWTHFKRRDYAAAAEAFERFLATYDRQGEAVPYLADALLRLGDSYSALRRFDDARAAYARVPSATTDRRGADYALYQTAQTLAAQERLAEAAATYERLLSAFPTSELYDATLYALGNVYFRQEDYARAIATFARLERERPGSNLVPRALYGIADAHFNAGRFADAEAGYRRLLERFPNDTFAADALDGLADALDAQGRAAEFDAAARAFEARTTDPAVRARLAIRRAENAALGGDPARAAELLERLLAQNPPPAQDVEARLALADAYRATGRPADAARVLRAVRQRFPDSPLVPEAELRLADALLAGGEAAGALDVAARFAAAFPDDAEQLAAALALEARALDALNRRADADARRRLLLERYPSSAAADELRRTRPDLGN
ncbi:MAG: tetratricopeptide repeat protein [Rubricoccaceae bacterium]